MAGKLYRLANSLKEIEWQNKLEDLTCRHTAFNENHSYKS